MTLPVPAIVSEAFPEEVTPAPALPKGERGRETWGGHGLGYPVAAGHLRLLPSPRDALAGPGCKAAARRVQAQAGGGRASVGWWQSWRWGLCLMRARSKRARGGEGSKQGVVPGVPRAAPGAPSRGAYHPRGWCWCWWYTGGAFQGAGGGLRSRARGVRSLERDRHQLHQRGLSRTSGLTPRGRGWDGGGGRHGGAPSGANKRGSPYTETGALRAALTAPLPRPPVASRPNGPKTLWDACGVRFKSGRLCKEYRPASSPEFEADKHSNSHRKIVEMRKCRDPEGEEGGARGGQGPSGHEAPATAPCGSQEV